MWSSRSFCIYNVGGCALCISRTRGVFEDDCPRPGLPRRCIRRPAPGGVQNSGWIGAFSEPRMLSRLRRLRLKGLIERIPGTHRYRVTPYGRQMATFFT
jgi:hypothetical protein